MRKIKRWFRDLFSPEELHNLDTASLVEAFHDAGVRSIWFMNLFDELKRINLDVDRHLLLGNQHGLTDLCARRKAYQDVLESILSAKRAVAQESRHNPPVAASHINLDRTTA